MNNRQLVEIRGADTDESLRRIQDSLTKARTRRKDAEKVKGGLEKLCYGDASIIDIDGLIRFCKSIAGKLEREWPELLPKITAAEEGLAQLNIKHSALLKSAIELTKGCSNEAQLGYHRNKTESLLNDKRGALKRIRKDIRKTAYTSRALLKRIEETKPLWGEHIETVAGMVLRDDKFDEGLCVLADQLVTTCVGPGPVGATNTLNILGRDHTVLKDLDYTVYFRFPAWSVWGLALIAHEFWHASCAGRADLQNHIKRIPQAATVWHEPLVQKCLADTFATYVIGPAYGFACVLLLLDVDSPLDRVRTQIVFSTLEHLATEAGAWYEFLPELKESWDEASRQEAPPAAPCLLAHQNNSCRLVGKLLETAARNGAPAERRVVRCELADGEGACPMKDATLIHRMHDALLDFMPTMSTDLRYPVDPWSADGQSLRELLKGESVENLGNLDLLIKRSVEPLGDTEGAADEKWLTWLKGLKSLKENKIDLRHVLHAAWLERWEAKDQDPERIKSIADRARWLCEQLADKVPQGAPVEDRNGPKW